MLIQEHFESKYKTFHSYQSNLYIYHQCLDGITQHQTLVSSNAHLNELQSNTHSESHATAEGLSEWSNEIPFSP